MKPLVPATEGRYAYEGLDRVMHERARLSMLTSLLTHPKGLNFNELKELCSLTDGNLNRHLAVLEENDLVQVTKNCTKNRLVTHVQITAHGRTRFHEYLEALEAVIRDADEARTAREGKQSPLLETG